MCQSKKKKKNQKDLQTSIIPKLCNSDVTSSNTDFKFKVVFIGHPVNSENIHQSFSMY